MLRTQRIGTIEFVSSDILGVQNAFTGRSGGVSEGDFASLNIGSKRGDNPDYVRENYRRVCSLFGVDENSAAVTSQVHGNTVRIVDRNDAHICMSTVPYDADGIVTAEKGLPIMCFTADCVPVLMADSEKHCVAAVHCGWRSSVSDILNNTVSAMESLGAKRENICAALGPSIGKCCFEVGSEVVEAIENYIGPFDAAEKNGRYFVDLRLANRIRLIQLGLKEENIDVSDECTFCLHDKYWSHRYTQKNNLNRGSQCSVIML